MTIFWMMHAMTNNKPLSIGLAWQEARVFLMREAALLVPVALLFISIPVALLLTLMPANIQPGMDATQAAKVSIPPAVGLAGIGVGLLMLVGLLTLYALALKPQISVREALQLAVRRLPVALGATLGIMAALFVPGALVASVSRPAGEALMILLGAVISVRLATLDAVIVDTQHGPLAAAKRAWTHSRGNALRLLAVIAMIGVALFAAMMTVQVVFGLVGLAFGGAAGVRPAGALGAAVALGLGRVLIAAMMARIYRQIEG
jgi:hypothetical protein